MDRNIGLGIALGVALGVAAPAVAQQAVQWRVEDGGNGHWYAHTAETLIWSQLRDACEAKGGHLVTLTSQAEWEWVKSQLGIPYYEGRFAGGYQDQFDHAYSEPNGGWKWVTGEPFLLNLGYMGSTTLVGPMTEPGFDDCPAGTIGYCGCGPAGAQDVLFFTGCCNHVLDDIGDGIVQNCDSEARKGIIEWSADCNSDGIVDFGQILDGVLFDGDTNGVPDCCDLGYDCFENLVANGSFEAGPAQTDCTWFVVGAGSTALAPWQVTQSTVDRVRQTTACTSVESWSAFDGEFTVDLDGFHPAGRITQVIPTTIGHEYRFSMQLAGNGYSGVRRGRVCVGDTALQFEYQCQSGWPQPWRPIAFTFNATTAWTTIIIESLSTVGQAGPVVDDVRVASFGPHCPADINQSGTIDAEDLAYVLFAWGMTGGKAGGADINGDATVDANDLSLVLGSWGPCPN